MISFNHCASSYLTFRYLVDPGWRWGSGWPPPSRAHVEGARRGVTHVSEIHEALCESVERAIASQPTGLLLSSGIDSAILAALLPRGTPCYTIRFRAEGAIDEAPCAASYARRFGHQHAVVDVDWRDYVEQVDPLMRHKRAPLHPVEVGLLCAARRAAADGVQQLVLGTGADSTFGGLDSLLGRDWTLDEFEARYTFLPPTRVLKDAVSMRPVYARYANGPAFDVQNFLKEIHGDGVSQAFANALGLAECGIVEPYEELRLEVPLDLHRIRSGESKYLLRALFRELYPDETLPAKIAFARPLDRWMRDVALPRRPEFLPLPALELSGEQRFQLYCLDRFMTLLERGA